MTPRGDCWVWDGYLGECVQWHSAQWWQYVNVFSISAVIVVALVAFIVVAAVAGRVNKR